MPRTMDDQLYTLQLVDGMGILNELKFGRGHASVQALAAAFLQRIMFPFTTGRGHSVYGAAVEAGTPVGLVLLFDNARYTTTAKGETQRDRSTRAKSTKPALAPPAAFNPSIGLDDELGNWGPEYYDRRENRGVFLGLVRRALVRQFSTAASVGWAPSLEMWVIDGSGRPPVSVRWSRAMDVEGLRVSSRVGGRGTLPVDVAVAAAVETANVEVDAAFTAVQCDVGESDYAFAYALRRWCELRVVRPGTHLRVLLRARDTDWTAVAMLMIAISKDGGFGAGFPAGLRISIHQTCDVLNARYDPSTPTRVMDINQAYSLAVKGVEAAAPGLGIPSVVSVATYVWLLRGGGDDYVSRLRFPDKTMTCGSGKDLLGAYLAWLQAATPVYAREVAGAGVLDPSAIAAAVRKMVCVVNVAWAPPPSASQRLPGGRYAHSTWTVRHRPTVLANMLAGKFCSTPAMASYVSAKAVTQMRSVGRAALQVVASRGASTEANAIVAQAVERWARNLNFSVTHCLRSMFDGVELSGKLRAGASPDCLELDTHRRPMWGFAMNQSSRLVVSSVAMQDAAPVSPPSAKHRVKAGSGFGRAPPPPPPTPPLTVKPRKVVDLAKGLDRVKVSKPRGLQLKPRPKAQPKAKPKAASKAASEGKRDREAADEDGDEFGAPTTTKRVSRFFKAPLDLTKT